MKKPFFLFLSININLPEDLSKDETIIYLCKFLQRHNKISFVLGMTVGAILAYFVIAYLNSGA